MARFDGVNGIELMLISKPLVSPGASDAFDDAVEFLIDNDVRGIPLTI